MPIVPKNTQPMNKAGPFVIAYGFDKIGFEYPRTINTVAGKTIQFVPISDPTEKLEGADGIVIPSGIFEKFEYVRGIAANSWRVHVDKNLLMEKEKQVHNLLNDGKWVCFLVGKIVDRLNDYGDGIPDTDLCKRVLNYYGIGRRQEPDGLTIQKSLCVEFEEYIRQYGVAKTIFSQHGKPGIVCNPIGKHDKMLTGFEVERNVFFLPFHTTRTDAAGFNDIMRIVVEAVSKYKQNRDKKVPEWANAFEFKEEATLKHEREEMNLRIIGIDDRIDKCVANKRILVTSGDELRNSLVRILREYFGLKIDALDEHKEDAKVIDEDGQTLVLLEVKAMGGGVGQDDVGQIKFHRNRSNLSDKIPGVLIANCNRKVTSIADRLEAKIDGNQIHYAKSLNVLIIRTMDLLFLMRQLEDKPMAERRDVVLKMFFAGGGRLKATEASYEIVTS